MNSLSENWIIETFNARKIYKVDIDFNIFSLNIFALLQLRFPFYKQLGSGLSPQSCSKVQTFKGFLDSKLLNGCLVVRPSNLHLQGVQ